MTAWVYPPTRPFCASSPEAEGDFWAAVNASMSGESVESLGLDGYEPDPPPDETHLIGLANPCPVCGSFEACMYDTEGRPMVHAVEADQ